MARPVVIPINAEFVAQFEALAKKISILDGKTWTAQDVAELALNMGFDLIESRTRAHMARPDRLHVVKGGRRVH